MSRAERVIALLEREQFHGVRDHVPLLLLRVFLEAWDALPKDAPHA